MIDGLNEIKPYTTSTKSVTRIVHAVLFILLMYDATSVDCYRFDFPMPKTYQQGSYASCTLTYSTEQ